MAKSEQARVFWLSWQAALTAALTAPAPALAGAYEAHCSPPPVARSSGRTSYAGPADLDARLSEARAGDTILLRTGSYGSVKLAGANPNFITVAGASGQRPVLSSLTIAGSHWVVQDLTIEARASNGGRLPPTKPGAWPFHDWMVKIRGGDNIILSHNHITSALGNFPWREEVLGLDDETPLWSGVLAQNAACVSITANVIENTFNGLTMEGDQKEKHGKYYHIVGNRIENFAGDAIDHSVSFLYIGSNNISHNHNICASICVHNDGIQGWNYHNQLGITNTDITINGNIVVQSPGDDPVQMGDSLQGITIFDGFWRDVRITNNVVITVIWHGISISGVKGLLIANNTVIGDTARHTWISAGGSTHQGGVSENVVIRNNVASWYEIPKAFAGKVRFDHNLRVTNPESLFRKFDPSGNQYDLRLRPGSKAIGAGSKDDAPARDIDGVLRSGRIDLGAYQNTY